MGGGARRPVSSPRNPYTPRELETIEELVGDLPLGLLVRRYNAWAEENGLPRRTERALHQRIKELGLTIEPYGEYVRAASILSALRVSQNVIEGWIRKGWIAPAKHRSKPYRRVHWRERGPVRRSFRRRDLVRMARDHPEAFAGAPREGLYSLLEDADLCDAIRAAHPRRLGCLNPARPVKNLSTGETYPSIRAAAEATGLHATLIRASVNKGHRAKGTRWADATDDNASADQNR